MQRGPAISRRSPILTSLHRFQSHDGLRREFIKTITLTYFPASHLKLDTVQPILRWRCVTLAFEPLPCLGMEKQKQGAQFI